jgi:glutamine amidotransferase
MIKIIDYGLGNIQAFVNLYKRLNIPAAVARNADELEGAERLILPGVGSFDYAMKLLQLSGMRELLDNLVLNRNIPVLGVCVGMQIMAARSEEGVLPGLGWIQASVRQLYGTEGNSELKLPHMGWNDVAPLDSSGLFAGLDREARFYFLHSYYFDCESLETVLAETDYGLRFACAVRLRNIYGVQFHPEKSHQFGVRLLKNFAEV